MKEEHFEDHLILFGLSRQEAVIYGILLENGKQTGYEVSKASGISRSNTYAALSALVEKGAAYLIEESAKRYIPVAPEEFCGNRIRRLEREKKWIQEHLPGISEETEGYITIEGRSNISDKVRNLLEHAQERVYFSASASCISQFKKEVDRLAESGKKIVLITDGDLPVKHAVIYVTASKGEQIGLIADSRYALSGEYGGESRDTCLYSGKKNFVNLFKNALSNEIRLIELQREGEKENE